MKDLQRGFLAKLFRGVVAKRLTLVETITTQSNQHEFQGTKPIKLLFGLDDRKQIETSFIWIEAEQQSFAADGFISWSNVRKNKPRAPEYHLYYSGNPVVEAMQPGDVVFIALRKNNTALVVVAPQNSSIMSQLFWLFGIDEQQQLELNKIYFDNDGDEKSTAVVTAYKSGAGSEADFIARFILDELGIEFEIPETDRLDELLKGFPNGLPSTKIFSQFARDTLTSKVSAIEEPDNTLLAWLDHEEKLFRRHEHFAIERKIESGFGGQGGSAVENSLKFYQSIFNARKSRMGQSLEHHAEAVFKANRLQFSRGAVTEHKNKPDFLFPGIESYRDQSYSSEKLTMLASKSTCKDRWRQVLSEASRVEFKHLLTLEAGISQNQTDEMRAKNLQLVVPELIHSSYNTTQQVWLMNMGEFVKMAQERQS
jgi:EcoRII C terminal